MGWLYFHHFHDHIYVMMMAWCFSGQWAEYDGADKDNVLWFYDDHTRIFLYHQIRTFIIIMCVLFFVLYMVNCLNIHLFDSLCSSSCHAIHKMKLRKKTYHILSVLCRAQLCVSPHHGLDIGSWSMIRHIGAK